MFGILDGNFPQILNEIILLQYLYLMFKEENLNL